MSHIDSREATAASAATDVLALIHEKCIGQTKPRSTQSEVSQLDQLELVQQLDDILHARLLRSGLENRGNDDRGVTAEGQ